MLNCEILHATVEGTNKRHIILRSLPLLQGWASRPIVCVVFLLYRVILCGAIILYGTVLYVQGRLLGLRKRLRAEGVLPVDTMMERKHTRTNKRTKRTRRTTLHLEPAHEIPLGQPRSTPLRWG